ncbi:hypothetical protein B0H16DRAFT_1494527 [Mycena metata]|uniref:Transmembrane protein n=1 Tax=Mycena metata TaxID=1033252 RepID=A0AAD7P0N6_9AGAR|nr:hypothetical protein B0H16DRAFT_1494527 [Mycena metata]
MKYPSHECQFKDLYRLFRENASFPLSMAMAMSTSGRTDYDISAYIRIGSISVASYDYLQTLPFEFRVWKELWRTRHLTLSFSLFFLIRYSSVLVMTVSTAGFFAHDFDRETCQRYFLIPSILKVVQTMVSQAILGFRAYNLSRKSATIGYALIIFYLMCCTVEWVATLYKRIMYYSPIYRNCGSISPQSLFGGWIHYAIAIIYDFATSVICIVFLLKLKTSSSSTMVRVSRMMLVDGVWYFVALVAANAVNMAFFRAAPIGNDVQTAAAALGYCVTWIMSQRLLIHLHEASVERRNGSIGSAVTITQHVASTRDVSRAMRSQFESKGMSFSLTVPDFDLESMVGTSVQDSEDVPVDVEVRIERTVRMEPVPLVYELEDYSRPARSRNRSKN